MTLSHICICESGMGKEFAFKLFDMYSECVTLRIYIYIYGRKGYGHMCEPDEKPYKSNMRYRMHAHTFPRLVLIIKKVVRKTRFVYKSPVFSTPPSRYSEANIHTACCWLRRLCVHTSILKG